MRDRLARYLSAHQIGVISTTGAAGVWSTPVRYCSDDLQVDCLVPRWTDVAFQVQEDPRVLLIVLDEPSDGSRWLEYRGTGRLVAEPDWTALRPARGRLAAPKDLYVVVRLTPTRVDLIDGSLGWGARETLEECVEQA